MFCAGLQAGAYEEPLLPNETQGSGLAGLSE